MERKRRKVLKDLVGTFWTEEPNLYFERFAPNHLPQASFVYMIPWCAATHIQRGTGRLLAVRLPEVRQELPQVTTQGMTSTTRFRVN